METVMHAYWKTFETPFRLVPQPLPSAARRFEGAALRQPEGLDSLVDWFAQALDSDVRKAVASMLTKYAASQLCAVLYGMSALNASLRLPLEAVQLDFAEPRSPLFHLVAQGVELTEAPQREAARDAWRSEIVASLYRDHLAVLFAGIAKYGVPKRTLWENALVYLRYYYSVWVKEATDEATAKRIRDDYAFITEAAGPELFGETDSNPFLRFDTALPPAADAQRATCCMRYLLPQSCCRICPLPEARSAAKT